jgi:hypothetical protein
MTAPLVTWRKEFDTMLDGYEVREHIKARDTPPGRSWPACFVCGESVRVVHVHHLLPKGRMGDGRPSNGGVVHPIGDGPGCHINEIHEPKRAGQGKVIAANGWLRPGGARRPRVYRMPLLCAWRGWIVLLDGPPWWRPATDRDMRGDYGDDQ